MAEYYTTTTTTTYSINTVAATTIENHTQHFNHQCNLQNVVVVTVVVVVVEVVCNLTNQLALTLNSSRSSSCFLSYMKKRNAIDFQVLNYRMVVGISFESCSQTNKINNQYCMREKLQEK